LIIIDYISTSVSTSPKMGFYLKKSGIINFEVYLPSEKYRFKYSTNIKIDPKNWDKTAQRPKKKKGAVGEKNKEITHDLNLYEEVLDTIKKEKGRSLTKQFLKYELDRFIKKEKIKEDKTLIDFLDTFIEEKESLGDASKASIVKYKYLKNQILIFQKKMNTTYMLSSIDNTFGIDFISFLRKDLKNSDNTLSRKIGLLKTFFNWCKRNDIELPKHNLASVKKRETSHIAITKKDMDKLEKFELPPDLDYARDLFLIGCHSGQRYSDYKNFNIAQKKRNFLEVRAKKTGQLSYIPLTKKLKKLLDKYEWSLRIISSQKFNPKIQKIFKLMGYTKLIERDLYYGNYKKTEKVPFYKMIGSHTARRSFITIAGSNSVPHQVIMQATGIKDLKTLQGYIKLDKEVLFDSISKAFD